MVEINEYYGKRYGAQADLMKTILSILFNFSNFDAKRVYS